MGLRQEEPESPYSVFISHASADAKTALEIVALLEAKNLSCWIAPRNVRPGAEYPEAILDGIARSKCFLLLVSDAANVSADVGREVKFAADRSKPIYPVRIEDVPLSPKLQYFVAMHQWLDAWGADRDHQIDALARSMQGTRLTQPPAPTPVRRPRQPLIIGAGLAIAAAAAIVAGVFVGQSKVEKDNAQSAGAANEPSPALPLSPPDGQGTTQTAEPTPSPPSQPGPSSVETTSPTTIDKQDSSAGDASTTGHEPDPPVSEASLTPLRYRVVQFASVVEQPGAEPKEIARVQPGDTLDGEKIDSARWVKVRLSDGRVGYLKKEMVTTY